MSHFSLTVFNRSEVVVVSHDFPSKQAALKAMPRLKFAGLLPELTDFLKYWSQQSRVFLVVLKNNSEQVSTLQELENFLDHDQVLSYWCRLVNCLDIPGSFNVFLKLQRFCLSVDSLPPLIPQLDFSYFTTDEIDIMWTIFAEPQERQIKLIECNF